MSEYHNKRAKEVLDKITYATIATSSSDNSTVDEVVVEEEVIVEGDDNSDAISKTRKELEDLDDLDI